MSISSATTRALFCAMFMGALIMMCSNQAQAKTTKVYPKDGKIEYIEIKTGNGKNSGLEIKLTSAGIKYGVTASGATALAKTVIRETKKVTSIGDSIKVVKLANQIQLHALAYTLHFRRGNANPINVYWGEILL